MGEGRREMGVGDGRWEKSQSPAPANKQPTHSVMSKITDGDVSKAELSVRCTNYSATADKSYQKPDRSASPIKLAGTPNAKVGKTLFESLAESPVVSGKDPHASLQAITWLGPPAG